MTQRDESTADETVVPLPAVRAWMTTRSRRFATAAKDLRDEDVREGAWSDPRRCLVGIRTDQDGG